MELSNKRITDSKKRQPKNIIQLSEAVLEILDAKTNKLRWVVFEKWGISKSVHERIKK